MQSHLAQAACQAACAVMVQQAHTSMHSGATLTSVHADWVQAGTQTDHASDKLIAGLQRPAKSENVKAQMVQITTTCSAVLSPRWPAAMQVMREYADSLPASAREAKQSAAAKPPLPQQQQQQQAASRQQPSLQALTPGESSSQMGGVGAGAFTNLLAGVIAADSPGGVSMAGQALVKHGRLHIMCPCLLCPLMDLSVD